MAFFYIHLLHISAYCTKNRQETLIKYMFDIVQMIDVIVRLNGTNIITLMAYYFETINIVHLDVESTGQ